MAMFESVLVANRGEIAVRVFRTCRELGIRTIAVYTDADAEALHRRSADVAVHVASYLDADDVLRAAREAGASAIHPGYGFLSENAAFARAVADAGLTLVGPTPESMEAMARKDHARAIAVEAGVPVVPRGEDAGFPVLVKAAAGGGGKGMRIVRSEGELEEAKAAAAREARTAFGDDTLLVEKYVERGRHIEVQVFGDTHGTVVAVGDRDCSVQRRHQKVIEEAPAPTLTSAQRSLVRDSAVALSKQVGYVGAGTVEFLLDSDTGEAYFLEMNTRLQVEHPVTEEITGLDLVELQLRVAAGEALPDVPEQRGHAIEARIYAEDPYAGFLPQAGRAGQVVWPRTNRDSREARGAHEPLQQRLVRVDHALESGQVVSTSYDPMLGKVIAFGSDREAARTALIAALDQTIIGGVQTNTGFVRALLASEEFKEAAIDTAWLDRNPPVAPDAGPARQLAARRLFINAMEPTGPFASDGFRLAAPAAAIRVPLDVDVELDDEPVVGATHVTSAAGEVFQAGQRWVFELPDPSRRHGPSAGDGTITSPMPGTVLEVRVAEGDAVEEGQVLGVVEAMKMELALKAPYAGTVDKVGVAAGQQVKLGEVLFDVREAD